MEENRAWMELGLEYWEALYERGILTDEEFERGLAKYQEALR